MYRPGVYSTPLSDDPPHLLEGSIEQDRTEQHHNLANKDQDLPGRVKYARMG